MKHLIRIFYRVYSVIINRIRMPSQDFDDEFKLTDEEEVLVDAVRSINFRVIHWYRNNSGRISRSLVEEWIYFEIRCAIEQYSDKVNVNTLFLHDIEKTELRINHMMLTELLTGYKTMKEVNYVNAARKRYNPIYDILRRLFKVPNSSYSAYKKLVHIKSMGD